MPTEEITAEFRHEIWSSTESPRFIVGSAQVQVDDGETAKGFDFSKAGYFPIKGLAEELQLKPGMTYRFFGEWKNSPKHGRQLHFRHLSRQSRAADVESLDIFASFPASANSQPCVCGRLGDLSASMC